MNLREAIGDWINDAADIVRDFLRNFRDYIAKAPFLAVLTCIATIASAVSGWYSYKASAAATQVAEIAQSFTERTYQDQIAMGHPSVEAMGGETFVSHIEPGQFSSDPSVSTYSLRIVLRNSGQRSSEHAWVGVAPGDADMAAYVLPVQVVELPKDVDVPVQFDLSRKPDTNYHSDWYVGFAYEDTVPGPVGSPSPVCSDINVVKMTSWPQDPNKDPFTRTLSTGSPIEVPPPHTDQSGQATFAEPPTLVQNALVEAMEREAPCRGKKL